MLRISLVIVSLLLMTACGAPYAWHGTEYDPAPAAPEFALGRTDGSPYRINDQAGDVLLLYFGYTYCPDVCPATLSELKWVVESLGEDGDRVQVLFVTVDPERDSPEVIDRYLTRFDAGFVGLTGSEQALAEARAGYGVFAERDPGGTDLEYLMTHTSRVFAIDPAGRLRLNYTFDAMPEDMLADVRQLLAEQS